MDTWSKSFSLGEWASDFALDEWATSFASNIENTAGINIIDPNRQGSTIGASILGRNIPLGSADGKKEEEVVSNVSGVDVTAGSDPKPQTRSISMNVLKTTNIDKHGRHTKEVIMSPTIVDTSRNEHNFSVGGPGKPKKFKR